LPQSSTVTEVVLRTPSPLSQEDRDGEQRETPKVQGETISDLLCTSLWGPDGIHPRVLKQLADVLAKPLSIVYQQSWLTGNIPVDWKLANVAPIYKKGWKKDPGNYRPVIVTLVPGKVMEQFILACEEQPEDQAQSAWVHERQVLLDQLDLLL